MVASCAHVLKLGLLKLNASADVARATEPTTQARRPSAPGVFVRIDRCRVDYIGSFAIKRNHPLAIR
jgi:hypothetical protein